MRWLIKGEKMKKLGLLALPLLLAACDKPAANVVLQPCCGLQEKLGETVVLNVWDDGRAVLHANGTEIAMNAPVAKDSIISWTGTFPGTNEGFEVVGTYDMNVKAFVDFDINTGETDALWGTITDAKIVAPVVLDIK